tara:strand:+ start:1346 stop:1645 length:300 start_codon:yes stop_codon:yes gene_type:complete
MRENKPPGGVAEWSKAAVLKTVRVYALVGSNPTSSATVSRYNGEMAELAEGARLLSEYGNKTPIEGSNPSLSARMLFFQHVRNAPIAQLDRAPDYGSGG